MNLPENKFIIKVVFQNLNKNGGDINISYDDAKSKDFLLNLFEQYLCHKYIV